jgi:hypothetical protein
MWNPQLGKLNAGAIKDRTSPRHKTDMVSGPPTLLNLSNNPKKGLVGTIDYKDIEKSRVHSIVY